MKEPTFSWKQAGVAVVMLMVVTANPAYSQNSGTQSESEVAIENVVVTGSRILTPNLEAANPITSLDEQGLRFVSLP